MTVEEVANHLDGSLQTVRPWIREGELDAYSFRGREYRITAAALEKFIAREQTAAERALQSPRAHVAKAHGAWRSVRGHRQLDPSTHEQPRRPQKRDTETPLELHSLTGKPDDRESHRIKNFSRGCVSVTSGRARLLTEARPVPHCPTRCRHTLARPPPRRRTVGGRA